MAVRVFFSYSHDDEAQRGQLDKHLASLKRQDLIAAWHDRKLLAGEHIDDTIRRELETADIILFLVSASFLASDYCYTREMQQALERHARGEARVVPVILRSCDWTSTPLGKLKAVPRDALAITSWPNQDEAYTDVAREIRALVERAAGKGTASAADGRGPPPPSEAAAPRVATAVPARSANVRLKQEFSDRDKANFMAESFESIAGYFEHSLQELEAHNQGIETDFQRVDKVLFTAFVYRNGKEVSACAVRLNRGRGFGEGITYSADAARADGSSYNEHLSVQADAHGLFLRSMGMASMTGRRDSERLSPTEAAELLWDILTRHLR